MDKDNDKDVEKETEITPQNFQRVAVIRIHQGYREGQQVLFKVNKSRITVGSVVSADVRLAGPDVAPIHAVIEVVHEPEEDSFVATIFDLASDSGIYVDDQKLVTGSLKGGERIRISDFIFSVSVEDRVEKPHSPEVKKASHQQLFLNPEEDLSPLILEDESQSEAIFQESTSQRKALEVVMSWRGSILDVQHFTESGEISVGPSNENTFIIPDILPNKKHVLIQDNEQGVSLNLDPQMDGIFHAEGKLKELDEISGSSFKINHDDFGKVSIGEVDFYFSFTNPPQTLKKRKILEKDPFFFKILLSSLAFTLAAILILLNVKIPETIEVEELPDRIATILYQPEKYSIYEADDAALSAGVKGPKVAQLNLRPSGKEKTEIPKELDLGVKRKKTPPKKKIDTSIKEGKQGEGARAKGAKGTRGTKKGRPDKERQFRAKRPGPKKGRGSGGGKSQVEDVGNLDILKGAGQKVAKLLGASAEKLGKTGGSFKGFGSFDTRGSGGLALQGGGKGGGGTSENLGGLGNKGRGAGRIGTGLGAAGKGKSIIGGRTQVVIRPGGNEEAVVMGAIDADAVEAALLRHKDEFRLCYEKEINTRNPEISGRIGTSFVIGPGGRVTRAGIVSSSIKNKNVERCIVRVIKRISFPNPKGGGIVQVNYPFKFRHLGGG